MQATAVINSQFHAALDMLEQAIANCPDAIWYDTAPKNRAWHIAYHALFYTHLYLQPTLEDFVPWAMHREEANRLPTTGEAYSQADLLEYLAICRAEVDRRTPEIDPDAASGFHWLPFSKLELQFYSLRHLMLHIGELAERLGSQGIDVAWRGRK